MPGIHTFAPSSTYELAGDTTIDDHALVTLASGAQFRPSGNVVVNGGALNASGNRSGPG
jgi:hypothetical protein